MAHTIYEIRNAITGRRYIGATPRLKARWAEHRCKLNAGKHACRRLQSDWSVHGADAFSFNVLERNVTNPTEAEQTWFDQADLTYNRRPRCQSNAGLKHTARAKAKISNTLRSKGHQPSKEAIAKSASLSRGKPKSQHVIAASQAGLKRWRETPGNLVRVAKEQSSLSESSVREIRNATGTYASIGAEHGISAAMVCLIRKGKRYAWVS